MSHLTFLTFGILPEWWMSHSSSSRKFQNGGCPIQAHSSRETGQPRFLPFKPGQPRLLLLHFLLSCRMAVLPPCLSFPSLPLQRMLRSRPQGRTLQTATCMRYIDQNAIEQDVQNYDRISIRCFTACN